MKIKNYIWVVGAWFCLHGQWALADQPMAYSDKLSELKSLEQYQQNNGFAAQKKTSQELSECSQPYSGSCKELLGQRTKKERLEEKYKNGDLYSVEIYFQLDKEFPKKYGGKRLFSNEPTDDAYNDKLREKLFSHFLGDGYEALYPELISSYRGKVGIKLFVYTSDQLYDLVNDERILYMYHIGNHADPEEVLL